jgi:hypothetical protein
MQPRTDKKKSEAVGKEEDDGVIDGKETEGVPVCWLVSRSERTAASAAWASMHCAREMQAGKTGPLWSSGWAGWERWLGLRETMSANVPSCCLTRERQGWQSCCCLRVQAPVLGEPWTRDSPKQRNVHKSMHANGSIN